MINRIQVNGGRYKFLDNDIITIGQKDGKNMIHTANILFRMKYSKVNKKVVVKKY